MILTDSMLDAAFRFRETESWKMLDDSNIFAVRLSNGQNVYCTIMGNGGEHYSLGIISVWRSSLNPNRSLEKASCYFLMTDLG